MKLILNDLVFSFVFFFCFLSLLFLARKTTDNLTYNETSWHFNFPLSAHFSFNSIKCNQITVIRHSDWVWIVVAVSFILCVFVWKMEQSMFRLHLKKKCNIYVWHLTNQKQKIQSLLTNQNPRAVILATYHSILILLNFSIV